MEVGRGKLSVIEAKAEINSSFVTKDEVYKTPSILMATYISRENEEIINLH